MIRRAVTRFLRFYSLHVRTDRGLPDYSRLLARIGQLPPALRTLQRKEKVVALERVDVAGDIVTLAAVEGLPGVSPLIYDLRSGQTRSGDLARGESVVTKTHCMIDLSTRTAIVEYNHRGARVTDIALVLGSAGTEAGDWGRVWVALNPLADIGFLSGLAEYERIRLATIRCARPNMDWTDHEAYFFRTAADSDAGEVEVTAVAQRDGSLSRSSGIVAMISQLAAHPLSVVKKAIVKGLRSQETRETTLQLDSEKNVRQITANVATDEDGHPQSDVVERAMVDALMRLRQRVP